jgi:anti-sigma factor RsiW
MNPVTENDLHALIDDQLTPQRRTEVEAWLLENEEDRLRVQAWRVQRSALDRLERATLDEPIPERLLAAAGPAAGPAAAAGRPGARYYALAAAIAVFAWSFGWVAHARWGQGSFSGLAAASEPRFVRDALLAYAVYSPEVRHPVEVAADQQEHLVQWLSKRLGKPLKAPRLDALGFSLLGGRLVPAESGANALFMYQNAAGERITIYVTVFDSHTPETAFHYTSEARGSSFYWVDRGLGYAVSGQLAKERILAVANTVYSQMSS